MKINLIWCFENMRSELALAKLSYLWDSNFSRRVSKFVYRYFSYKTATSITPAIREYIFSFRIGFRNVCQLYKLTLVYLVTFPNGAHSSMDCFFLLTWRKNSPRFTSLVNIALNVNKRRMSLLKWLFTPAFWDQLKKLFI